MIKCVVPPSLFERSVRVEISNNGVRGRTNISTNGAWFTYDARVTIKEIHPSSGPTTGNHTIRITGENFLPTDELKCKFGASVVQGAWLNGAEAVCRTPAHVAGTYNLEITLNDQDYTDQRIPFLFYRPLVLERITPVSGPGEAAGTEVHVYGENFVNISTLTCRFSDTDVPAVYISSREIICYTPPCLKSYTGDSGYPPADYRTGRKEVLGPNIPGGCHMVWQPLVAHENRDINPTTGLPVRYLEWKLS